MVDHHFLLYLLGMTWRHRLAYYGCMVGFVAALAICDREKRSAGLDPTETADSAEQQQKLAALPPAVRRRVFRAELAVMVLEYGIFTTFINGMTSGVGAASSRPRLATRRRRR